MLDLNTYQSKAMSTCLPTCENIIYMLSGLTAEIGEVNDLIAKWVRKGIARIENNILVFNTYDEAERDEYMLLLKKELGDCEWLLTGLETVCGFNKVDVCEMNIEKLAARKKEGTIITHTDH
jgi:hypothetical protein